MEERKKVVSQVVVVVAGEENVIKGLEELKRYRALLWPPFSGDYYRAPLRLMWLANYIN